MLFPSAGYPDVRPGLPPLLFQVKAALDALAQKIATFTDVGNSLAHVEHLLKDLSSFEEKSSVRTGHGPVWAGDSLEVVLTAPAGLLRKARDLCSSAI